MSKTQVGFAQRAARGERVCGDTHLVLASETGVTIAVADGAGHGTAAAEPALEFCSYVKANPADSLETILEGAHVRLARTRGAAAALLRVDETNNRLRFCGVGNIEVQSCAQEAIRPVCIPGILGRRVRRVQAFEYAITRGDVIVLYTDGISGRFTPNRFLHLEPTAMAAQILEEHGKDYDDATCLVIRYG